MLRGILFGAKIVCRQKMSPPIFYVLCAVNIHRQDVLRKSHSISRNDNLSNFPGQREDYRGFKFNECNCGPPKIIQRSKIIGNLKNYGIVGV